VDDDNEEAGVFFIALSMYFGSKRSEKDAERKECVDVSVEDSENMELLQIDESGEYSYRFQLSPLLIGILPTQDWSSIPYHVVLEAEGRRE
jgi:hypothetical protein